MKQAYKILLVEDVPADAELIGRELLNEHIHFTSMRVDTERQFVNALTSFTPDIIISDQSLPQFDAFSAMKILKGMGSEVPFILATGTIPDDEALEYLKWGAYDYVLKTNLKRLPFAVKNALMKHSLLREKRNVELEHQQLQKNHQVSSERNKDITDSMIYAHGIQKALLPRQSYIHRYFPESFLINMPKHIVSGDFYWFSECDGKIIVAVGDCTGHGVPGALISMMGYNKLDHIVNVSGVTDPAQILTRLNSEIKGSFKGGDKENSIRDGMDIAICTIDRKNNRIEFSGANRPLYYIKDHTLEIIKGDKKCIGGNWERTNEKYTKHILPLNTTSTIYLFTDGYLDQFGGELGKKFLGKQFKTLLSSALPHTMNDQKNILLNALNEWKGMSEQTDDICVLGIRF